MFAGLGLGLGLLARTGQRWAPSFTHKIVLPRLPTFFLSSFRSFYATPSIAITLNQATRRKRHKKVQKTIAQARCLPPNEGRLHTLIRHKAQETQLGQT